MRNLFCDQDALRVEEDVKQIFARRLIEALGYPDKDIRPDTSLERLDIGNLGADRWHRPDFAMKANGHIRWVLETKTPGEPLHRHFAQANGYCESINNAYDFPRPVEWFILTDGTATRLHKPGESRAVMEMAFSDFAETNPKYQQLRACSVLKRF